MRKLWMLLIVLLPIVSQAQTPDTTYSVGPDQASATGAYEHYYQLTRGSSFLGVVLQGRDNPYAGSCRNVWCALVPSNATNGVGQSGGTFSSFNAAAHEVVRVWNSLHPGDTLTTPVPVPVDTTPKIDSSYVNVRIATPTGAVTAYNVFHHDTLVGKVVQAPAGRWNAYPPDAANPIGVWTTLRAASYALVRQYQHPVIVPPPVTDTVHKTIYVYDTLRTTVTMPPDTVKPRVILPVDTVFMRVGDPPLSLQAGDTVKIPIRVLPACGCDSLNIPVDTVEHLITNGLSVKDAGVDTVGLHIYDWQSRVGENSVYLGTKLLGRITLDNTNTWVAYRYTEGQMVMPRDTNAYPTKAAAMRALAKPQP